jgi:hypothetical protein
MDDLLPSKQDLDWRTKPLFSGGGIMVQQLVRDWVGRRDTRTLIWFGLKNWAFFIYSQVLCEIVSSFKVKGLFCEILSRLMLKTDILSLCCRLCFWGLRRVVASEALTLDWPLHSWEHCH